MVASEITMNRKENIWKRLCTRWKLHWLYSTPKTVSNNTALTNLKHAEKIMVALEFSKTVREIAKIIRLAGPTASPRKEMLQLLLSGSASLTTTAWTKLKQPLPPLLLILNSASKKSALISGLLARRTLSAFPHSKTAKRNAEQRRAVGLSAYPPREAKQPLT